MKEKTFSERPVQRCQLFLALGLVCIFFQLGAAGAESRPAGPGPAVSKKLISEVWSKIQRGFYDPNMNGVDWNSVKTRYLELCLKAGSWEDLYDLVDEMIAELRSSHTAFAPTDDPRRKSRAYNTGINVCRLSTGEYAVHSLDEDSANGGKGLEPGMIITKVDGLAALEHAENLRMLIKKRIGTPSEAAIEGLLARFFFHGHAQNSVQVEARTTEGKLIAATLSRYRKQPTSSVRTKRFNDKIGYLAFSSWTTANQGKVLDALAAFRDLDGLILDLRDNSGGDDQPTSKITSVFFESKTPWGYWIERSGKRTSFVTSSSDIRFRGKLAVLINERSASASENFANLVQEQGRGRVFGRNSAGALTATRWDKVNGGKVGYPHRLQFSASGKKIEGVGVKPDMVVEWSVADLMSGIDPDIEAAKDFLAGE